MAAHSHADSFRQEVARVWASEDARDDVLRRRAVAVRLFPGSGPDEALMRLEYELDNGKPLDLDNLSDIASKLHWLKLNDRRLEYGRVVDKFEARAYVSSRVGPHVLNTCYALAATPDELSSANLPSQFILKATHGWNMNLVVHDASALDWHSAHRRMEAWLTVRHHLRHGEWPYSLVPPRILAEELLLPAAGDLLDYKFFCFDGAPHFFKVDAGRSTVRHQRYYDLSGRALPFSVRRYEPLPQEVCRPHHLQEMAAVAAELSRGLPFVRVDLYEHGGGVRFGELTLYPCGGNLRFDPYRWSEWAGTLLELPEPTHATRSAGAIDKP